MINEINQTLYRLDNLDSVQRKLSYQTSTKEKLEYGSDDATLYSRLINIDNKIRTYDGLQTQVQRTTLQNNTADSSMSEIKKILEYVKSELIKANTDTTTGSGLSAIASGIAGMKENLYDLANTQIEGEYVFAGSNSSVKPFEKQSDGSISYMGNNKLRKVAVEEGSYRDRGVTGLDIMTYTSATATSTATVTTPLTFKPTDRIIDQDGNMWNLDKVNNQLVKYDPTGKVVTPSTTASLTSAPGATTLTVNVPLSTTFEVKSNIFSQIDDVVNALNKKDSTGATISDATAKSLIATGLDNINTAYDSVNVAHAQLGGRNKVFETAQERVDSKLTQYKLLSEQLGGANLTEVAVKTKALELTYTALYSTINKTSQLSLVNFIK